MPFSKGHNKRTCRIFSTLSFFAEHQSEKCDQGRRQKIFQGEGQSKIALFSLFQGGATEKGRKIAKKAKK